jgi:hypothetical protein
LCYYYLEGIHAVIARMYPIVVSLSALTLAVELVGKRKTNHQNLKFKFGKKAERRLKTAAMDAVIETRLSDHMKYVAKFTIT